ncbi:hypothetical protein Patl1_22025 [Pistacia atlantica]|uniref:Uncharacterized protein n=1 Tax=Pistacia atlantica TaxID=434234 RepID=A0ACC1BM72_9ROSI|nr:hypothetical protein Patl1_22025 [Pistacia atlantica]
MLITDFVSNPRVWYFSLLLKEGDQPAQVLRVEDEERGEWRFHLTIRRGRYRKPVLSAVDWLRFVRSKQLESGFKVQLFKEEDEATGEVKYKIKQEKPVLLFEIVLTRLTSVPLKAK